MYFHYKLQIPDHGGLFTYYEARCGDQSTSDTQRGHGEGGREGGGEREREREREREKERERERETSSD